jgi:aminoglycoside phosphotransferase (APT) family kinase protein
MPLNVKQFSFGQSNPSYQLTDSRGRKYVLRTQPGGERMSKSAHRVDREYYVMRAMKLKGFPVPRVHSLCTDLSILGKVFYIMEFMEGRIFPDLNTTELSSSDQWQCWKSAIQTLADLHNIDPRFLDLPPEFKLTYSSHFPRQVKILETISNRQAAIKSTSGDAVGPIPGIKKILRYLSSQRPAERISFVHGDYKIDNLIYHPTENRVIAVLDWELCTIGHPLADVGNLLHSYFIPRTLESPVRGIADYGQSLTTGPVQRHLEVYSTASGWDPSSEFSYAIIFAHFRLSVITQGIKARTLQGLASNENASKIASSFVPLANMALEGIESTSSTIPLKL